MHRQRESLRTSLLWDLVVLLKGKWSNYVPEMSTEMKEGSRLLSVLGH